MLATCDPFARTRTLQRVVAAVAILGSLAVAVVDVLIAQELSLSILHVVGVGVAAWCGGLTPAFTVAGIAGGDALIHTARSGGPGNPGLVVAGGLIEFGILVLTALAVAWARRLVVAHADRAMHDALTGALSRGAFEQLAGRELRRIARHGRPMSVAYLDIDDFKHVNDTRGHAEGDRLLRTLAEAVVRSVRAGDAFSRVGGDEFVLLLPDADAVDAAGVVRRILAEVRRSTTASTPVTLSVGVATFREPPAAVHDMVTHADELMYRAKHAGGDRVVGSVIRPASTPWPVDVSLTDQPEYEALAIR
jgi:diguanylate cyclase (GGDEF)-like protein